jgi:hypothetical protein
LSYIYSNERYHGYSDALAFREVMNYISDAENVHSNVLTSYTDLLPDGHPRRPDTQSREELAEYLSTQAPESIETALVASICAEPGSMEREFNNYAVTEQGISYQYLVDLADSLLAAATSGTEEFEDEGYADYMAHLAELDAEDRLKYDDRFADDARRGRLAPEALKPDPDNADALAPMDGTDVAPEQ